MPASDWKTELTAWTLSVGPWLLVAVPVLTLLALVAWSRTRTPRRPRTVIVHGPQGSGKSRHAEALARHYGVARIIDEWDGESHVPTHDALVLTHCRPAALWTLGEYVVSINDALRAAGIEVEDRAPSVAVRDLIERWIIGRDYPTDPIDLETLLREALLLSREEHSILVRGIAARALRELGWHAKVSRAPNRYGSFRLWVKEGTVALPDGSAAIAVYQVDDQCWYAARSPEEAVKQYVDDTGEDGGLEEIEPVSGLRLETLKFVDSDEQGAPVGQPRTFRDELEQRVANAHPFPCLFACADL